MWALGSICAELVYQLQARGARIAEVPVSHYPRVAGRSEFMRPHRVARSLVMLGRLWWQLRLRPWPGRAAARLVPGPRGA